MAFHGVKITGKDGFTSVHFRLNTPYFITIYPVYTYPPAEERVSFCGSNNHKP